MSEPKRSPMIEQYLALKARHPEAILLARVGDFYEAYGDDAETISAALQIALTSKDSGGGTRIAMAGVPHHALDAYLARLVAQRRVVALAEQLEAPVPNKLVRRDVMRVVTPGTLIEDRLLEPGRENLLAAVTATGEAIALATADVSTGRTAATAYAGDRAFEDALAELARLGPSEIVADLPAEEREALAAALPGARIATSPLAEAFGVGPESLAAFSVEEAAAIARALAALAAFVKRVGLGASGASLREPSYYRAHGFVTLDASTRRHLELVRPTGDDPKATLLATVDRCVTAMGSRMLARRLLAPLVDVTAIALRADGVAALVDDYPARTALRELLRTTFDLERIAQRVRLRRVAPRDLGSLRRTLAALEPIAGNLPLGLADFAEPLGDHQKLLVTLEATLCDDLPATLDEGGAIRPEAMPEVGDAVARRSAARDGIAALELRERERTGIKNLKVKYASAFGYALEITKSQLALAPEHYVRKQTLTGAERFTIPELRELEAQIAGARGDQVRVEAECYAALVETVALSLDALAATADTLAELDVACGLAHVASERGYVRPTFVATSTLDVTDGRHPVVEAVVGTGFVPNDLHLAETRERFAVVTGPNMGGKSTYLRQSALLVILAQIGSFVPATAMTLGVVDRIFTRIGAGDDLASGRSTFFVEMAEASAILRRCTRRSLVLVDEVGRGTGTIDGLAIAQAICEYLLGLDARAPMTLFATHFHELVALAERWPLVANFHVTAVESSSRGGAPVFSHRVLAGSTSRSFGIEVAKMAGLPPTVIERAREIAGALDARPTVDRQVPLRTKLAATDGREETQLGFDW